MTYALLEIIALIAVGLSLSFIIADGIANKKFSVISTFLFIVVALAFCIKFFSPKDYEKFFGDIKRIDLYYLLASGVEFLLSFILFLIHTHKTKAIKNLLLNGVNYTENNFAAYLTLNNRFVLVSKKLDEVFKRSVEKNKELSLKQVFVNDKEVKYKKLSRVLGSNNFKIDESVNFKFVYANDFITEMNLTKKLVYRKKHKCGFVLIDNSVSNSYKYNLNLEFKRNLYLYFDLLDEAIAYYDEDNKEFVLTKMLRKELQADRDALSYETFLTLLHPDDVEVFKDVNIAEGKMSSINFRLLIKEDYVWFEENSIVLANKRFLLVKRMDLNKAGKVLFGNYRGLVKHITKLIDDQKYFGLIMVSMSNLNKDFADVLISKYFVRILNHVLKDQTAIYKIGLAEFAFLVESEEYLRHILSEIQNNTSELLKQVIMINKDKYELNCEIGMVLSTDVENKDARDVLKAAFDTLREVTDPDYPRNYSLYQKKNAVEESYDLKALGIDLEKDLEKFTSEFKE